MALFCIFGNIIDVYDRMRLSGKIGFAFLCVCELLNYWLLISQNNQLCYKNSFLIELNNLKRI